ncbi:hypothetical protein CBR_g28834 [Chara braunii]|uniref:Uncharacterized protein n=1 Tax=Chara braunii TaxID=69332 RepID=A0A388L9X9_CHABU|nr:hypothetical protein CBR_g28834 [Chara braunii]|eukprot:GBG79119.1 hypothetical protein CBR_g28834 [Chara braunii]
MQIIIDTMMTAFSQAEKTYELPTLELAPIGLEKPKSGVRADRLKHEDLKDELADQYYYYAVSGQHNAAAAKMLLGTGVALRYNFGKWPARMVYFSDEEFDGHFLVSSEDNMKDLKAPPRQLKLSMKDIRWLWKEKGFPNAVIGNPSGKQAQVKTWREFCSQALHKTPYNHLWLLGDEKGEDSIKKQNAVLRSYFPLVMAGKSAWELGMEFFEKWETGRLLAPEGARWITRKRKVQSVRPGVSHIENDKWRRKEVVYNVPVEVPQKKGKKEKEPGDWFVQVTEPDPHCWKSMRDNGAEYMRRKEHMLALLDNYHDASRKNAKNFLDRLECLYFVESEQVLKLESYGALISTDDEVETDVVFDTATPEEDSVSEDINIDYHPAPTFHAPGSSSAGPSTS